MLGRPAAAQGAPLGSGSGALPPQGGASARATSLDAGNRGSIAGQSSLAAAEPALGMFSGATQTPSSIGDFAGVAGAGGSASSAAASSQAPRYRSSTRQSLGGSTPMFSCERQADAATVPSIPFGAAAGTSGGSTDSAYEAIDTEQLQPHVPPHLRRPSANVSLGASNVAAALENAAPAMPSAPSPLPQYFAPPAYQPEQLPPERSSQLPPPPFSADSTRNPSVSPSIPTAPLHRAATAVGAGAQSAEPRPLPAGFSIDAADSGVMVDDAAVRAFPPAPVPDPSASPAPMLDLVSMGARAAAFVGVRAAANAASAARAAASALRRPPPDAAAHAPVPSQPTGPCSTVPSRPCPAIPPSVASSPPIDSAAACAAACGESSTCPSQSRFVPPPFTSQNPYPPPPPFQAASTPAEIAIRTQSSTSASSAARFREPMNAQDVELLARAERLENLLQREQIAQREARERGAIIEAELAHMRMGPTASNAQLLDVASRGSSDALLSGRQPPSSSDYTSHFEPPSFGTQAASGGGALPTGSAGSSYEEQANAIAQRAQFAQESLRRSYLQHTGGSASSGVGSANVPAPGRVPTHSSYSTPHPGPTPYNDTADSDSSVASSQYRSAPAGNAAHFRQYAHSSPHPLDPAFHPYSAPSANTSRRPDRHVHFDPPPPPSVACSSSSALDPRLLAEAIAQGTATAVSSAMAATAQNTAEAVSNAMAANQRNAVPKQFSFVADPGHVFGWAVTDLPHRPLSRYTTSITAAQHRTLCPQSRHSLEIALDQATPAKLLSELSMLVQLDHRLPHVSAIDFSDAYCRMLRRLVASVAAIENFDLASRTAADHLFRALEHSSRQLEASGNLQLVHHRRVWHELSSSGVPSTPWEIFVSLARAFIPLDATGSENDYRRYLVSRFKCTTTASAPSSVLAQARRIVRAQRHFKDCAENDQDFVVEVKSLFIQWLDAMMEDETLAPLLRPLKQLSDNAQYINTGIHDWEVQIRLWEGPNSQLQPLLASMTPAAPLPVPRAPRGPPRLPAQPQMQQPPQVNSVQPSPSPSAPPPPSYHALPPPQVQQPPQHPPLPPRPPVQPPPQVPPMAAALQPAPLLPPPAPPPLPLQPSPYLPPVLQPAQPVQGAPQPLATVPQASSGLQPAMQQHFVPPAVYAVQPLANSAGVVYFQPQDPAFAVTVSKMDATWVARFGCSEYPPPSTRPLDRPYQKVRQICHAAGVPLPEDFQDRPHIGGTSCPGCNWVASNQGFGPMVWFLHPNDVQAPENQAAKPPGRQNGYLHQVAKCGYNAAIAHCVVRRDRDAGRGDINVSLFERRPF
ncbi:hypothetical protein OAO87_00075 [bacterium]|nr:hypothetical protein [bacterium]